MDKFKINQYKSAFDGMAHYIENEQHEQVGDHFRDLTKMIAIRKIKISDFSTKPIVSIADAAKKAKKGGKL